MVLESDSLGVGAPFSELRDACGADWPAICQARERTRKRRERLSALLANFDDRSFSIVVFGSLGRGEVTDSSDVDWCLLVDGPANPTIFDALWEIGEALKENGFKPPGATKTFGALIDSHQLIQHIAGTRDTNENLTRRILLLLESYPLTAEEVRGRVVRSLIGRYVDSDTTAPRLTAQNYMIPLFFLNDVVRYWRTMATDFAAKMWERRGEEWAIRNIKLRFSRKLIFAAGLLAAFAAELHPDADAKKVSFDIDREAVNGELRESLSKQLQMTPLDSLCATLMSLGDRTAALALARELVGAYDQFLGIMADEAKHEILKNLDLHTAASDPAWAEARDASHRFRNALDGLFFESESKLPNLIRRYGVF